MATAIDAKTWSDEFKDAKCSICAQENRDEIADYYCFDCNKHICKACLGIHNRFIVNHNIVQGLADGKDVLTEKCGKHADELITLYCRQHDELLCRKCHLLDHRKCQDAQNIRESSDELNAQPELEAVPAQLKSALAIIKKAIIALDMHVASIEKNGSVFLKDLEVYANKLLSLIEELKEKGKKDIKSKQDELLALAKHHRQACALTKDEISQCLHKITKSKEQKASMFVLKKKGQTIAQKVDALYNESDSLIKGHHLNFMTEMKIFDSINCFYSLVKEVSTKVQDISSQGAIRGEVDGPVQAIEIGPGDHQEGRRVKKGGNRTVVRSEKKPSVEKSPDRKLFRKINVRIPKDMNTFDIYGCCHLSDGSLVIADYSNRILKRVDPSSGKVTKHCYTDGKPRDVCCIGPQEVAVAFGSTQVHVYNAVSLTRTGTFELGHKTSRIACHGGLLYCDAAGRLGNYILYVHDVSDGSWLREIRLKDPNQGLSVVFGWDQLSHISDIAVNGPGDRLYVTDWRGLLCVNMDGQEIFHRSEKKLGLSDAQGVTTDHRGHVFVSGCESNNVVKVTEDGHVVGEILSGIECPHCLSYDVSRRQLCVGGESDQILMVEWK